MRRAVFVAVAISALFLGTGAVALPPFFDDVKPGDWFYDDVQSIAEAGITAGYPDGTFRPNNSITRAEMAAMLNRAGPVVATNTELVAGEVQDHDEIDVISVTVDVPAVPTGVQYVHVVGTFAAYLDVGDTLASVTDDPSVLVNGWLTEPGGPQGAPDRVGDAWVWISADEDGGTATVQGVFPASTGEHTYVLRLRSFRASKGPVTLGPASLTATTYPFTSTDFGWP